MTTKPTAGNNSMNPKKPKCFLSLSLKRGKYFKVMLFIPKGMKVATSAEKENKTRVSPISSVLRNLGWMIIRLIKPMIIPVYVTIVLFMP